MCSKYRPTTLPSFWLLGYSLQFNLIAVTLVILTKDAFREQNLFTFLPYADACCHIVLPLLLFTYPGTYFWHGHVPLSYYARRRPWPLGLPLTLNARTCIVCQVTNPCTNFELPMSKRCDQVDPPSDRYFQYELQPLGWASRPTCTMRDLFVRD